MLKSTQWSMLHDQRGQGDAFADILALWCALGAPSWQAARAARVAATAAVDSQSQTKFSTGTSVTSTSSTFITCTLWIWNPYPPRTSRMGHGSVPNITPDQHGCKMVQQGPLGHHWGQSDVQGRTLQ